MPLAVYVAAMLAIPLAAVGWLSVSAVARNNELARNAESISAAVALHSTAVEAVGPVETERVLSVHAAGDDAARLDLSERLADARETSDVAIERLIATLAEEPDEADEVQTIRGARSLVSLNRAALDSGTISPGSIDVAFAAIASQIDDVAKRTAETLATTDHGSAEAFDATGRQRAACDLVTAAVEQSRLVSRDAAGLVAASEAEVLLAAARFDAAIDAARPLDPARVAELREVQGSLNTAGPDAMVDQLDYLAAVNRFVLDTEDAIQQDLEVWADDARSKNRVTVVALLLVAVASLLVGAFVIRSFARPLARLRLRAERISNGDLDADPITVTGPSDVRKVTVAINDMAGALSLVEAQMDSLERAAMTNTPSLEHFTGHVGASMRASMERVVALTSRLQTSQCQLNEQARIDALTGLPNRFAVLEYLEGVLWALGAPDAPTAPGGRRATGLMFLDIDGFKSINDTHGHPVGDLVLRQIAQRLSESVREVDFVARLGGDEFLVVVADMADPQSLVEFGNRMISEIEQPYTIRDQLFAVSASVGVTVLEPGDDAMAAIERADAAVYQAKDRGRRRVELFDDDLQSSIEREAEFEAALRDAIRNDELRMYLQPCADLATGETCGAEALVRWNREGVGLVPPSEFIPVAERSGLIFELERWMLRRVCECIAKWTAPGQDGLRLALNISGKHLLEGDLVGDIDAVIAATGADPSRLQIELAESHVLDQVERASVALEAIRERGVKVAIDDFGTGYSSMTHLQRLPVDVVKIDRSFIWSAASNPLDSTVIDTIVTIGTALGLDVVAEGIETLEQLDNAINIGVTHGQGFLLSRPLPVEEAEAVVFSERLFRREAASAAPSRTTRRPHRPTGSTRQESRSS